MLKNDDEKEKVSDRFMKLTPFICALMVIGIHSYNAGGVDQLSTTARIEGSLSHGLFTAAVPIFMFLSGFLFYRNADTLHDVIAKQKRRLTSDLIPFIGWSGFYYVIFTVKNALSTSNHAAIEISIGSIIKGIVFYKHIYPMWFMFQLLVYIALAQVIFITLKKTKISMFVLCLAVVLAYFKANWIVTVDNDSRTIFAFNFFAYYFAGAVAAKNQERFIQSMDRLARIPWIIVCSFLIVTSIIAGLAFDVLPVYNQRIMVPAVASISFVALYKYSKCMVSAGGTGKNKIPTMIMYGMHPLIGIITGRILDAVGMNKLLSYFLMFLLVSCTTCCGALIMKRIPITNLIFNGNRE